MQNLDEDLYFPSNDDINGSGSGPSEISKKNRLVACLPIFSKWSRNVWEGVPDNAVESLMAVREFEGFAGLIFGDWAPR